MSNCTLYWKIHKRITAPYRKVMWLTLFMILSCGPGAENSVIKTALPTLTPTPRFLQWQAEQVVQVIQSTALECQNPHPVTSADFGSAPFLASAGFVCATPSACPGCQGIILSFDSRQALETTKQYYINNNSSGASAAWVFVKGNILLRFDAELPEAEARKYGAVLIELK